MVTAYALVALLQAAAPVTPPADSVVVVQAGAKHGAGGFYKFFFGDGWRDLWSTPISVPVANLDTIGGGLKAYEHGGHAQTRSLRFRAADGRIYYFRSIEKYPAQAFTGVMRAPPLVWMANVQIGGMFPTAVLAVSELEREAGVIPTERRIVVLPDSPRLGEWRDEFKGMLGILERRLAPKGEGVGDLIPGALDVISTDTLFPLLQRDGLSTVDQERYLTARLLDLMIGDWDRHDDQWSWIRFDHDALHWWVPLPRDRDWALSRLDGIVYDLLRFPKPSWTEFGPRYGHVGGLTSSAEPLDRRLLTGLDSEQWNAAVAELRRRLSDSVIAAALGRLPQEFGAPTLIDVGNSLKLRREALAQLAPQFYRRLAEAVDVRGSHDSELAEITRDADGSVTIELLAPNRARVYRRRFVPTDTREVRLYLLGGADTVRVRGSDGGIPVRLITAGAVEIRDSTGGRDLLVYDDSGRARLHSTGTVRHIVRPFTSPVSPNNPHALFRDWGRGMGLAPWLAVRPELGTVLGGGPVLTTYGFRRVPYQTRVAFRVGTTTKAGELNADLRGDLRFERPDRRVLFNAEVLNADVIRYFGFGNQSIRTPTIAFHNVVQRQYALEPRVLLGIGGVTRLELGGLLRWSKTDTTRVTQLLEERPYGTGSFAEAGLRAAIVYDSRDDQRVPTSGVTLELAGRFFPAILDVTSSFGSVGLTGTTYLTARKLPAAPTLAFRAGALRVIGTYPFFEAANIGGWETLRGLTTRRYAGDAALYSNAELRFNLGHWGPLALADLGRVFLEGESSRRWHPALGGGMWFAPSIRNLMVSAILAGSGERLRFYVHTGFHF